MSAWLRALAALATSSAFGPCSLELVLAAQVATSAV